MGARWSGLWVRARDAAAAVALAEDEGVEAAPGRFVRVRDEDFDGELLDPARWGDLGAREPSRAGEAVYVAMYDGPAGELCGTFLYERAVDGQVVRALVFAPDLAGEPDGRLRWRRVEGTPEPWEAPVIAARLDAALARAQEDRAWRDPPLPPLTADALADLRRRWSAFVAGEDGPTWPAAEYELSARALDPVG